MKPHPGAPAILAVGIFVSTALAAHLTAHDRVTTRVTWNREISRIVLARCAGCHARGGSTPMPLTTYEEARPWAVSIKEEVLARRMPKWHAARGYGDFANDPSLSPFEIALVAAWADGGAPESEKGARAGEQAETAVAAVSSQTPPAGRTRTLACGTQPLAGRLIAVRPNLEQGGWAGIVTALPGGRREIVAWIRNYDPAYPTTYWLRSPIDLPAGSRLIVESSSRCSIDVTLARWRARGGSRGRGATLNAGDAEEQRYFSPDTPDFLRARR
jgi:hypothetical protein